MFLIQKTILSSNLYDKDEDEVGTKLDYLFLDIVDHCNIEVLQLSRQNC